MIKQTLFQSNHGDTARTLMYNLGFTSSRQVLKINFPPPPVEQQLTGFLCKKVPLPYKKFQGSEKFRPMSVSLRRLTWDDTFRNCIKLPL